MTPKEILDKIDEVGMENFLEDMDYEELYKTTDGHLMSQLTDVWHAYEGYMWERISLIQTLEREVYNVG